MLDAPRCNERRCINFAGAGQPANPQDRRDEFEAGQVWVCPAFPGGIPDDIAFGDNLHLELDERQAAGTEGIVYERAEV